MKFLVNGIHLNVEIEGEGEPLLLIHGLGGNIDQMRVDMKSLSTKYKTIAYDCRGHGNSDKPASYTLNDHIQDAKALLEELRIEKTRVIGVSAGSYIAQGLAADYPDAIHKLILVVPKAHGTKSSVQLFWERHADELAGMSEAEQMSYFLNHAFAPGFLEKIEPKIVQIILRPEPILSAGESAAANKAFHDFDLRPVLHRITAPTLVISGKMDGLNPPEYGKEVASHIKGAIFVEMIHSGHAPSFEEPEKFSELVLDFFYG